MDRMEANVVNLLKIMRLNNYKKNYRIDFLVSVYEIWRSVTLECKVVFLRCSWVNILNCDTT
jgi:hypothetical protein